VTHLFYDSAPEIAESYLSKNDDFLEAWMAKAGSLQVE
jgi:hypothetical protein